MQRHMTTETLVPIPDDRHQIAEAFEYAGLMDPPPGWREALQTVERLEAEGRDPRIYLRNGRVKIYARKEPIDGDR